MTVFETCIVLGALLFLCIMVAFVFAQLHRIVIGIDRLLCNTSTLCELLSDDAVVTYTGSPQANEELEELKQMVARSRKYTDKVKGEAKNAGQRKSRQV